MTDMKTHYQYKIQMEASSGEWYDVTEPFGEYSLTLSLFKEAHRDDVRLVRRMITVGEWEVQK
jgi:hypothetical protein